MLDMKELAKKINEELSFSSIIGSRVELIKKGNEYVGLCPNPEHNDHGVGSFCVNDQKHIAKCFSCGFGCKNAITFISDFDKISRFEAILRIALEANLISKEEYLKASSEKNFNPKAKIELKQSNLKSSNGEIADEETLNLVYSILTDGKKLEGESSALTDEHLAYLSNRGISKQEIKKNKYFSMPTRRAMRNIRKKLTLFDESDDVLKYVPGFYYNQEKGFFTLNPVKGIGIPIKNEDGKIIAIQIRKDVVKTGEQRYHWFSSAFASDSFGASPGSPIDIVKPSEVKNSVLFITEGHFKAAVIANTFNSLVISVQGVGNWKGVKNGVSYLKNNIKNILIAFDADMAHNEAVMKQALKMAKALKTSFSDLGIYFLVWDEDKGKGIDDLILEGNRKYLKKIEFLEFVRTYKNFIKEVSEKNRKEIFKKYFLEK